jgi:Flp pilus assembly protein TadG
MRPRRDPEKGDAALELIVLAPVLLALIALIIAAGRISIARGSVAAAARDAARQASLARSPGAARIAAEVSAQAALRQDGLDCVPTVFVDTTDFGAPLGQPAQVSAIVTCQVPLADLVVPGLPGSVTLRYTFTSPLDPYRGR